MLALQNLEAESLSQGPLDPELVEMAADAEEYLDSEYAESAPSPNVPAGADVRETYFDDEAEDAASPRVGLEQMAPEQEHALVAAVAERFGGAVTPGVRSGDALAATLRLTIDELSIDELRSLDAQIGGKQKTGANGTAEGHDARQTVLRSILTSLTADAPPELLQLDGEAALGALELPLLPLRHAEDRAPSPHATSHGSEGAPSEFWVDATRAPSAPSAMRSPADDLVSATPTGAALTPQEMAQVHAPDLADTLQLNLEQRARRKAPVGRQHFPYQSTGRFVFTELTRPHKKVPLASRVWVSEANASRADDERTVREPNEAELRSAMLRAQPPILKPRIKRNAR